MADDFPTNLVDANQFERSRRIEYTIAEDTLREVTGIPGENRTEIGIISAIQEGEIDLRNVLSEKESLSREEYVNWLQQEVDAAQGLDRAIEREAYTIAEEAVKDALREHGHDPADLGPDEIERLAAEAIEEHPEFSKEAERRVRRRQEVTLESLRPDRDESTDDGEDS